MRSSQPKLLLITCDLLFVAAIILALFSTDSAATPASSRLYFAAALLCLIACATGWILGLRHESRKKKHHTQAPPHPNPHDS